MVEIKCSDNVGCTVFRPYFIGFDLVSGLGAGFAPTSLQKHGISTTIVEIDPAVYSAARTYFGLPDPGKGNVFLEDARGWITNRRKAIQGPQAELFDIVIHDCFSGGGVPSHVFTVEFWQELKDVVKPDGVVAIVSFTYVL